MKAEYIRLIIPHPTKREIMWYKVINNQWFRLTKATFGHDKFKHTVLAWEKIDEPTEIIKDAKSFTTHSEYEMKLIRQICTLDKIR